MAKFTKKIVENSENFLIKKFIAEFKRKIKNKGKSRFSFVLTGGNSPVKLYKNLAKEKNIPWKNIMNLHRDTVQLVFMKFKLKMMYLNL